MMIFGSNVIAPDDAEAASWIASRLGEFGTVGGLVPDGFDLYLLVRPASLADGSADDTEQIATVASIAERPTATPDLIWFAIWEGYGWATGTTFYRVSDHRLPTWLVRARGRVRSRVADRSPHRLIRP